MGRTTKEDYARHYRDYQSKPDVMKKRANANKARRLVTEAKGAAAVRGKDVHHIKPQRSGGATTLKNLRPETVKKNRGWKRGS